LIAAEAARLGTWAVVLGAAARGAHIACKFVSRQRFLRKIRIARITPEDLKTRHREIPRERDIVLYCT
jgi:hypothetical protein